MRRVPGRKILRRVLRPLERRFFPGAIVLGYHRVADEAWDPLNLQVRPRHFAAQLAELQRLRTVISLQELVERQVAGEPLDNYAVLTFDDGYSDFAETVVPIATRSAASVTVFVASGCTGHQFWWEELTAFADRHGLTLQAAVGRLLAVGLVTHTAEERGYQVILRDPGGQADRHIILPV